MAVRNRTVVPLLATYRSASVGRQPAAAADHADRRRRRIVFDGDAELAQRLDHHPGVFAVQRAGQAATRPRPARRRPAPGW